MLVGGEVAVLEAARPVLACYAENITHVGPVGAVHGMKLAHNFVSLGMVTLLAEASASASAHGITPEAFVEVLAKGGGGGIALDRIKPYLLAGDTGGLKFSLANARKDLDYYGQMAAGSGAHRAVAEAVLETLVLGLSRAEGQGREGALVPELAALLRT
jgi:3-hydroxyisobutyrate dehydrogenase-like beta-hydroxyacid dehydrogenase